MSRTLFQRFWYQLIRRLAQLPAVLVYRTRYTGLENIPAEGPVLAVSNHQSHFDPPLVGVGSPRRMNYVARRTLFDVPIIGRLMASVDAIPIDRDGLGLGGIKESLRRLKNGEMVLIFPEGTRTPDGEVKAFRPGFSALAVRSKASILPIGIDGAYEAWPRSQSRPGFGRIRVHFGRPIPFEEIVGRDEHELVAEVEHRVRECISAAKKK
jgi:1-acyl-sn-glycerol-3-phosphate acyltransferase